MEPSPIAQDISRLIWETRYRYVAPDGATEHAIEDTWRRVAGALASVEPKQKPYWEKQFYRALEGFKFLPGGRIQAGAGTAHRVTLFNCFVMGIIEDSMDGIFDSLKEGALTMQQGGGVGYDFSTLRPEGTRAHTTGAIASGPVSFMRIWNAMCAEILSTGARRGAMMATLRCDHPDIETFIEAKRAPGALQHFNLSVLVTDDFMQAVKADSTWTLVFPEGRLDGSESETVLRSWTGAPNPVPCRVLRRIPARSLWDKIVRAAYDHAEPGVLFIDRINRRNNLAYAETITATNPCGEIPLPPYGACNLGSINLTRFVHHPFTHRARLDMDGIRSLAQVAVRMLDNVTDLSLFPLDVQSRQAHRSRRIGLGITGLADALIMLGLRYGEPSAREIAADIMRNICQAAYRTSIELGREKGCFPLFDRDRFLESSFVRELPPDIREGIALHGLRNSHLLAIAPTGTISLLAGNISSGIEPVFDFHPMRVITNEDGTCSKHDLTDYAYHLWLTTYGSRDLPGDVFVTALQLLPEGHLEMQAALQPFVDNAISKTINIPVSYPFEAFRSLFVDAFEKGLKGCTVFRPNEVTGAILEPGEESPPSLHCCSIEREAD